MKARLISLVCLVSLLISGCGSFLTPVGISSDISTLDPQEVSTEPREEKKPSPMTTIDMSKISAKVTLYPVETTPAPMISVNILPKTPQTFDSFTEGFIVKAKNDLSQQTGINLDKIKVLSAEAVEWPDGSLGCGKPGTEYLQVVTPGFLIVLEANDQIYTYHTNISSQIILCNEKLPIRFSPTP